MHRSVRTRGRRGQALVETAIILPVLLTIAIGASDIGRAFAYQEAVVNAARQGLRLAVSSSQQATANYACQALGGSVSTALPAAASSPIQTIADAMALEQSSAGTPATSLLAGATVTVSWHCSGSVAVTNSGNHGVYDPSDSRSDAAEVRVSYSLATITPFVAGMLKRSTLAITSDQVGRMEY